MVSSDTAESCGEISKHSRKEFSPPAQQQQQQTNSISTSKKEEKATTTSVMHECTNCATKTSPVWRKGPMGPKTLCNACGLKWSQGKMQLDDRGKHNKPSSPPTTTTTLLSHHQPPASQSQPSSTTCSPTEENELLSTRTTTKTTRMTSMDLTNNNGGSNNFLTPPGTQPQQQQIPQQISASPANNHNNITVTQLLRHHQLQNPQLQQQQQQLQQTQPTANNNISTTATLSSLFSAFSPTYPLTMPSIPQTRQHHQHHHQLSPPPTSPIAQAQAHLFNQHQQMSNTTTCNNNNNNTNNHTNNNNTTFVAFSLQQQPTTSSPNIALTPTKSTPTSSQKRKLSSTTTTKQQQFSTLQDNNNNNNNNESSSTPTPTTPNTHHTHNMNSLPTTPTPLRIKKNSKTGRKICSNCGAIKTPVWRKGPLGTGTLCNACGLKYSLGTITLDPLTGAIPGKQSFLEIVSEDDDDDRDGDEHEHGHERDMIVNGENHETKNGERGENSSQNHHHGGGKSGKLLELKSGGRKLSSSSSSSSGGGGGGTVRVKKTKNSGATLTTTLTSTKKMKKVMKKQREKSKSKSVRKSSSSSGSRSSSGSSSEKRSSRFGNVVENDDQFYDFDDFEGDEDDQYDDDDDDEMVNDSEIMNDEFDDDNDNDGDGDGGTMEDFEFSTTQRAMYKNSPISSISSRQQQQQQQKALLKMKNRKKLQVIPVRDSSVTSQQKSSRFLLSENCHFYTRLLPQVIEPTLNCHNDCCDLLSLSSNNNIVQKHDEMFLSVFVDRSRRMDKKRKMFNSRESSEEEEEKRENDDENVRKQKKQRRMHDLSTFYGYSGTLVPCNLMTLPKNVCKSHDREHEQVEKNMAMMIHSRLERNTMTFIMMFLDLKSLYSCMTVCKQWSRIILNNDNESNEELLERKTVSMQNVSKNGSDGGSDDGKRNINSLLSSSLWMKVYDARWTIRNDDVLKSLFMRRDCRVQWRRLVQARLSVEQNENQNENKSTIVLEMNNANGEYEQFLKQYCVFDQIQAKEAAAQVAEVVENKEKSGVAAAATDVAPLRPDQQQTTDQPPQSLPREQSLPLSVQ